MELIKKIIVFCCFVSGSVYAGFGDIYSKAVIKRADTASHLVPQKEDKELAQELVLDALTEKQYGRAESLLQLHKTMLTENDDTITQQYEKIRELCKDTLDAELSVQMRQQSFVPYNPCKSEPIEHNLFFDRVLAHITYDAHSKNQAVVTASKNSAILAQAQSYLDSIRDRCKRDNDHYNETYQCPVCLDAPGLKKMMVCCEQNHVMCVPCFNNKGVHNCSICRGNLIFEKVGICQQCGIQDNLTFVHCDHCKTVDVMCDSCTSLPCCTRHRIKSQSDDVIKKIHDHGVGIIQTIQAQSKAYKEEQRKAMKKELDDVIAMAKKEIEEAEEIDTQVNSVKSVLSEYMKKGTPLHTEEAQAILQKDRHLKEQLSQINEKIATLKKQHENIQKTYNVRIQAHEEEVNIQIDAVKTLAEKSTGSPLRMPESGIPAALRALFAMLSEEDDQ